jgi:hypothetical protein
VLKFVVTVGGLETATKASKVLRREMGVKMCDNTLRNALREQGLSSFTKVKKPTKFESEEHQR